MSSTHDPNGGTPNAGIGKQPSDVEQARFGRGPAEHLETSFPSEHPKGLWVLFITEMWERFSYYGMRALLVLYLIASTSEANSNPGFGWSNEDAYLLYGLYTWAVYLTPIVGGWLADKFLGTHRSMLIGGWIIAAGHVTLAMTEFFGHTVGEAVTMQTGPGAVVCFISGLLLIIIGTGFFKPCVSVMVGQLYGDGDPRRDSGFTIFYMGINLGAFLSPIVAGTLGETVGWHYGFGAAAVGMVLGLIFYQIFRPKYLHGIGLPPHHKAEKTGDAPPTPEEIAKAERDEYEATRKLTLVDVQRLLVIIILAFIGNIFFWTAFEQAGSSMNVFALEDTRRPFPLPEWFRSFCTDAGYIPWWLALVIGLVICVPFYLRYFARIFTGKLATAIGWTSAIVGASTIALAIWKLAHPSSLASSLGTMVEFPASWYQSVNALTIVACAPFFSILWVWLAKRNADPSTPLKFALGLWILGLSFLAMVFGAIEAHESADGRAGPHWLFITYVVYTWGELCLSPVGLSMVTKLAPKRLQSLMMGFWFFTFSLANLFAGLVARFSTKFLPSESGDPGEWKFFIEGLPGFYLMLVVFPIGAGVFLFLISPILKRMMHGVK